MNEHRDPSLRSYQAKGNQCRPATDFECSAALGSQIAELLLVGGAVLGSQQSSEG